MRIKLTNQAGDTLVEVLLATVVISMVLAGAYTLSNRARTLNFQANDRSRAAAFMQQQAEYMRSARDSFNPAAIGPPQNWDVIKSYAQPNGSIAPIDTDCDDFGGLVAARGGANVLHVNTSGVVVGDIYAPESYYRVWTEVESGVTPESFSLHIFACWQAAGVSETQRSKMILRLGEIND